MPENNWFGYDSLKDYLNSEEYQKNVEKYQQSEEFKHDMLAIRKRIHKRKRQELLEIFKRNAYNIINTAIALAALIIAILK